MKILALASAGGHWIQLLRLAPAFEKHEVIFVSTKPKFAETVKDFEFYCIPDTNRNDKSGILMGIVKIFRLVLKVKPDVVITTGAAPGLIGLVAAKCIGSKTIWVDSIANVEKFSLSGRIAQKFSDRVYTQWPELANEKSIFEGNVLI
ncbi:glycosyltransferase [Flavimarina sp. Hel_I_48]|uniref:glycosyltransferase n=1 Tax=Flavimarina sp. Hel_I_48 TaxID=1392488 RepID=UPI0004DFB96B|nr:glycosyltransferase [Flavimarina sp. Hel_I_48]